MRSFKAGPPVEKFVTAKVTEPEPPDCVVRILKVKFVVPVYASNFVPLLESVVPVKAAEKEASGATVTDRVDVPVSVA